MVIFGQTSEFTGLYQELPINQQQEVAPLRKRGDQLGLLTFKLENYGEK
jgi:hypothetical protein